MYHVTPLFKDIYSDASLTGLGGNLKIMYMPYLCPIIIRATILPNQVLEMLNVVVALKIWSHHWANKCIKLFCYNRAVEDVLSSGRAQDQILATCARNVWLLTTTYNIVLVVSHILGAHNNVADLLSRWKNTQRMSKNCTT